MLCCQRASKFAPLFRDCACCAAKEHQTSFHPGGTVHAVLPESIKLPFHSAGMKGGSVLNPINALAKLLAGMVDEDNHITVQGFYE